MNDRKSSIKNFKIITLKLKINTTHFEIMSEVNLKVNDENIPLNDFMEDMLKNLLLGYLNSAKGIPEEVKSINVKIDL